METQTIEEQILTLFTELPGSRQAAVLDQLHEFLKYDEGDIEFEIIDEEEEP